MNIFNKITRENMKKNRTRTLVTIIGVVLSAAMITAVATFAISLQDYTIRGASERYGKWQVAFPDVTASFVEKQANNAEVANTASIENLGYAALSTNKNPNKPYLFLTGFNQSDFDQLPLKLISGRLPKDSSEVLIPEHLASNGGVHFAVGDKITLNLGDRRQEDRVLGQHDPYLTEGKPGEFKEKLVSKMEKAYKVVGICQRPSFEEFAAPGYTLVTVADPAVPSTSRSLFVTLKNPRKVKAYAEKIAGKKSYVLNENVLRFMGLSEDTIFNTLLFSVGGILVLLVMIGSVFLIYNSFVISLNERIQQFGILSSVGATPKQLRNSVLFEGICIGAIGIPAGALVGLGSIRLVISLVAKNFSNIMYADVPLKLIISVPVLLFAAGISLITILISAYLPARKAANTPVMESIRQTNEVKVEAKSIRTSKVAKRLYGLEGTLALKNFKRNKRRYRSIVLSLTLSVVLFVAARSFGAHLQQAAERSVVDSDYDLVFTTPDMPEKELFQLYEELKIVDGVSASSYQAIVNYSTVVPTTELSAAYREGLQDSKTKTHAFPLTIQFIEDSEYQKFLQSLNLPVKEYMGTNAKMTAVAKTKTEKQANGKSDLLNLFAQDKQTLTITPKTEDPNAVQQQVEVTFVDTIPLDTLPSQPGESKPYVFIIVAPYQLKEQFSPVGIDQQLGLTFLSDQPAQTVKEMDAIIQKKGIAAAYTLYNAKEIFDQNRNIIFVVNVFTYVFLVMISLIAVANVFNTISTNIKLRRRELAMLRSVGMSDRGFNKMMLFECAFYGLRALLLGIPAASIIAWLIYKGMVAGGAEITFVFPWESMLISILSVFLIVLITMFYAVSKLKKENIIDALRDDLA
ncbi:ABC transporter permease [Enterococcus sp. AZ163]|uniref:ABC transporter permease n=1 Tax=Enterococcus sp. AZ163 TaxID=2774638 RepID=UPI003D28252E